MSRDFDWEVLRRDVAEVQRPLTDDAEELRRGRARLLLSTSAAPRPSRRRFEPYLAALLAAAIVLVVVGARWFWLRPEAVLSYRADAAAVRFSDGSVVSLDPETRARVVRVSARDADITLEQGALKLSVVHHEGARWHVGAGPFRVLVTGTQFDVSWSATAATFSLLLREGRVKVEGPTLGAHGRWVQVGEQLHIALAEGPSSKPSAAPPVTERLPEPPPPASVGTSTTKPDAAPALGAWKELARSQRYREALAAAEAAGFDATCRAASASELVLLGNSARFAGSAARAEQAFRLVRSRFPGSSEASMAAFYLGRIAYDQRGDRRQAAEWFQSYLREAPGGALAREAAGRLLEAERALGDRAAAQAAARAYLQQYPSGPHAGLARELLEP